LVHCAAGGGLVLAGGDAAVLFCASGGEAIAIMTISALIKAEIFS
jgi:hypothetical protein